MVDPTKITNYNLDQQQLEEVVLFWVCAAGKNGVTAARSLDNLLSKWRCLGRSAFQIVRKLVAMHDLPQEMKLAGIGCYNNKAKTFNALAHSGLNLKDCSLDCLESIPGIGPKTARCFLLHSRPNQQYAGLDTHILSFMRDCGISAPRSTPSGKKYRNLENQFLQIVKMSKKTVADLDLIIWNVYSGRSVDKFDIELLEKLKIDYHQRMIQNVESNCSLVSE